MIYQNSIYIFIYIYIMYIHNIYIILNHHQNNALKHFGAKHIHICDHLAFHEHNKRVCVCMNLCVCCCCMPLSR